MNSANVKPRIIIHGGAGNITRGNLSPSQWHKYRGSLLRILRSTNALLSESDTTALSAAVHAVRLLEEDPLFNAGKGAVFTRDGKIELEASVMVTRGSRKLGAGVSLLKHVKSPITLAAELVKRGNEDDGGGGWGHLQLSGPQAEELAEEWGLELCDEDYFWTRKRWEQHKKGLKDNKGPQSMTGAEASDDEDEDDRTFAEDDPPWDGKEYMPKGTVGCVVLDRFGTIAVATSTGGKNNKLPGRIGDTPTIGAGFWAEEWMDSYETEPVLYHVPSLTARILHNLADLDPFGILRRIIGQRPAYLPLYGAVGLDAKTDERRHGVAMSGTGNGDSFLLLAAVRTAAALVRFSTRQKVSLASAVTWMAGPGGQLEKSAEDRWDTTDEGEGGIIGIELVHGKGHVVFDFNRAMFRAWIDENGCENAMIFRGDYD